MQIPTRNFTLDSRVSTQGGGASNTATPDRKPIRVALRFGGVVDDACLSSGRAGRPPR
jgi:hypothetical protein